MAAKTFPDIAATDRDAESPCTEDLFGDYHTRDEAAISQRVDTTFDEASKTSASFVDLLSPHKLVYIPAPVTTAASVVRLVVVLEVKITGGTSADIRVRLGSAGTYVTITGITRTTYDGTRETFTLSATDVAAAADSEESLIIQVLKTGGGSVEVRCLDSASRLEAATV